MTQRVTIVTLCHNCDTPGNPSIENCAGAARPPQVRLHEGGGGGRDQQCGGGAWGGAGRQEEETQGQVSCDWSTSYHAVLSSYWSS